MINNDNFNKLQQDLLTKSLNLYRQFSAELNPQETLELIANNICAILCYVGNNVFNENTPLELKNVFIEMIAKNSMKMIKNIHLKGCNDEKFINNKCE